MVLLLNLDSHMHDRGTCLRWHRVPGKASQSSPSFAIHTDASAAVQVQVAYCVQSFAADPLSRLSVLQHSQPEVQALGRVGIGKPVATLFVGMNRMPEVANSSVVVMWTAGRSAANCLVENHDEDDRRKMKALAKFPIQWELNKPDSRKA